jgi:hypothetical protein
VAGVAGVIVATLWASGGPARAVVLADGDRDSNTSASQDDPGWANVGQYGDFTATYLGNQWAITADHLPAAAEIVFGDRRVPVQSGSMTLTNPPYPLLPGSAQALLDENGLTQASEFTDLRLVRLAEDPGLPGLTISVERPRYLEDYPTDVVLIGCGRDRQDDRIKWHVDDLGGGNLRWTEVNPPDADGAGHDYTVWGYRYASTQTKRWGTNTILADGLVRDDQDIFTLQTEFRSDLAKATPWESQATLGDSGGAVFYKNGDNWELTGIMIGASPIVGTGLQGGQPPDTVLFGNWTAMADLSIYRDEILELMAPQLQAGDADQNLKLDQLDLVRVLVADKYLTGDPATWGEGDWDRAPGGRPGNPPAGNGRFDQRDIIAALNNGLYLTGFYAATGSPGGLSGESPSIPPRQVGFVCVPEPSSLPLLMLAAVAAVGFVGKYSPSRW